jgi:hypothetical protein
MLLDIPDFHNFQDHIQGTSVFDHNQVCVCISNSESINKNSKNHIKLVKNNQTDLTFKIQAKVSRFETDFIKGSFGPIIN